MSRFRSSNAFIVAGSSAARSLSYGQLADALGDLGVGAERVSSEPDAMGAVLLVHSLTGDADKARQLAKRADSARIIPMQCMLDGAEIAVSLGMPAAIVRDGYARWVDGRDNRPEMPSGLVVAPSTAKSLGLEAAIETDAATATNSSVALPEQLARVLAMIAAARQS